MWPSRRVVAVIILDTTTSTLTQYGPKDSNFKSHTSVYRNENQVDVKKVFEMKKYLSRIHTHTRTYTFTP